MNQDLVKNIKWMALVGAIVCTIAMFNQRMEYVGITIGSSIVAAALFGCFTAMHLHDLGPKEDK